MEIYGVCLNRLLHNDTFEQLMRTVSEERRARVKRFIQPEDANRGLIGEALIRAVILSKFQLRNDQITFTTERYGKPCAAGIPSFHFNIAHSGRWIVCAVDCEPVGIDIEELKPVSFDIAQYCFSKQEYQWLMDKEESERTSCFYDLWTLKESFIKRAGKGLSVPLQTFSILIEADHSISLQPADNEIPCFFTQLNVDPDYRMAVCSAAGPFTGHLILKQVDELII